MIYNYACNPNDKEIKMQLIIDLINGNLLEAQGSGLYAFVYYFTNILHILFFVFYLHQIIYMIVGTVKHKKIDAYKPKKLAKIGIVISARNESRVIGNLIKSIKASTYPSGLYNIFVIADNCTDNTAEICRRLGCIVFERNDEKLIGKGYALHYLFEQLHKQARWANYLPDAYIVLDADNVIKPNYIFEMNKVFDRGYEMITSYRNSKNIGKNWISAGYGYWFMHESRHLNNSRMMLGTSCAISGTGFLISRRLVERYDNWSFFTLTEDIQCSTTYALDGGRVGYCPTAEFFDEQPETLRQSYRQRERWAKGFYQVFGKYGKSLICKCFKRFACYDVLTTIFPALMVTLTLFVSLPIVMAIGGIMGDMALVAYAGATLVKSLLKYYLIMLIMSILVVITERKKIHCSTKRKVLHIFTFPFFMFTYIPISVTALFKKVKWKPIYHSGNMSLSDIVSCED